MVDIELVVTNKDSQKLIKYIYDKIGLGLPNVSVKFDSEQGFSRFLFQDPKRLKCPFSVWFSIGTGDTCFFNIGDIGDGATVFHHVRVSEEYENILLFFDDFVSCSIEETKIHCKGKLKLVEYFLLGNLPYPRFRFINGSVLFCISKSVEKKIYQRWH